MAAFVRPNNSSLSGLFTAFSCLLVLLAFVSHAACLPTAPALGSVDLSDVQHWKRFQPVVVTSDDGTNTTVINPNTNEDIPQGAATDGGGVDFSVPAIIWLAFVFAVGAPLALAGIRLSRATTGAGIGLTLTVLGESISAHRMCICSDTLLKHSMGGIYQHHVCCRHT